MSPAAAYGPPLRLAIFGAAGQVGRALQDAAAAAALPVAAFERSAVDIADPAAVAAAADSLPADGRAVVAVNAAAYTRVDRAESDADRAFAVNRDGAGHVASACAQRDWPLVHLSTDYVFGGAADRPWREDDPPAPVNLYGASKLAGEAAVRAALPQALVLRTAWVYSRDGANFVKTMLRLGDERAALQVVDDQIGSPTAAPSIAAAILTLAGRLVGDPGAPSGGLYHFAGAGAVSRFVFAQAIFAEAARHRRPTPALFAVPSAAMPTPAPRPANTALDCTRIARDFAVVAPPWREPLGPVVDAICGGSPAAAVREAPWGPR